jgi:toxin YoeB
MNCIERSGLKRSPRREGNAISRESVFQPEFLEDLRYWVETDRRVAVKVLELVEAALRDPVKGIGKPELLKYLGPGVWSRRITQEHRMVYLVSEDRIDFLQCRYHYR